MGLEIVMWSLTIDSESGFAENVRGTMLPVITDETTNGRDLRD